VLVVCVVLHFTESLLLRFRLPLQDEVLIAGFGRRGHAVGDIPGVRFKVRSSAQHTGQLVLHRQLKSIVCKAGAAVQRVQQEGQRLATCSPAHVLSAFAGPLCM
jgi:hypothetical protein